MLLGLSAIGMMTTPGYGTDERKSFSRPKTPLTAKQKKVRSKNKAARKARKAHRK